MFSGIGFDELFFIGVLAALFLDIKQVGRVLKWVRTTRGKLSNWQYDIEEKMDDYLKDDIQKPRAITSKISKPMSTSDATSLRRIKKIQIAEMSLEEKAKQSLILCEQLSKFLPFKEATNVLVFSPLLDEPDIKHLFEPLLASTKTLYFPKVSQNTLSIHQVQNIQKDLSLGQFDILEPNTPAIDSPEIDFILVPGVVFSQFGERIGRGKGFYDRFLSQLPNQPTKCGVCFEIQLVSDYIPQDFHDIPMDFVITSQQTIVKETGTTI